MSAQRQVQIEPLKGSTNILRINNSSKIVAASSNNRNLCVVTEKEYPLLLDLKTETIKSFQNPKNFPFTQPTAVAVDSESKYIVTGHVDGSVSVFSVDANYTLSTSFKGLHSNEITAIGFSSIPGTFYVGDAIGLTTRIAMGKIISTSLKESEVYKARSPVMQIYFARPDFAFPVGVVVMANQIILIDPTKNGKEQVSEESDLFDDFPQVVFQEASHAKISLTVFSKDLCYQYTLPNANTLALDGSTVVLKNPNERVTRAMAWNNKMIVIVTNYSIVRFINLLDITGYIDRKVPNYEDRVVNRKQSPLSQAILNNSLYMNSYNDVLYAVIPKLVMKLTFTPWTNVVGKYVSKSNWDLAFQTIIDVSNFQALDSIGVSDRASQTLLSIKKITEGVILKYIQATLETKDDEKIKTAIVETLKVACRVAVQKFMITDILTLLEKEGHAQAFYTAVFSNPEIVAVDYVDPVFVKRFLTISKEHNELDYAEQCLMKIRVPQNYAIDIASIIYKFGLIKTFSRIMVFVFQDYVTPCVVLEDDYEKFKDFIKSVFFDRPRIGASHRNRGNSENRKGKGNNANANSEESNHSSEMNERFVKMRNLAQKTICFWLFCPTGMLGFLRLEKVIDNDVEFAANILSKVTNFFPIQYSFAQEFTHSHFADSVMQVLNQKAADGNDCQYQKFLPILDVVCPLYAFPEVEVTRCSLRLLCSWAFRSVDQPQAIRVMILTKIRRKYPTLISDADFEDFAVAAGFKFAIEKRFLKEKKFDIIVKAMITDPVNRKIIFDYLEHHVAEDREAVKEAVLANIDGLILSNSDLLVEFVSKHFPELNDQIVKNELKTNLLKLLYLNSLQIHDPEDKSHLDEIFPLICEFRPADVRLFYTEHAEELDKEKAKEACKKFNISDCFVAIARLSNDAESANRAVERTLIDILETEGVDKIQCTSETQLAEYPLLAQGLNAVNALLEFQNDMLGSKKDDSSAPSSMKELIFFGAFTFPLFHSRTKPESVRKIIFLLFTHFIVGSIETVPIQFLFKVLFRHIRQFEFAEIQALLTQLSDEIEFKQRQSKSLLEMSADDTCSLLDDVFKFVTKGRSSTVNICCATCLKSLNPPQYGEIFVFPCGHLFHNSEECIQLKDEEGHPKKPESCPICTKGDDLQDTISVQPPQGAQKLSKSAINALIRRMNFVLKRNYGEDVDDYRPSSVCFAPERRDIAEEAFQVKPIEITAKPYSIKIPK